VDRQPIQNVAADQRRRAEAHGANDQPVMLDRHFDGIERLRSWHTVDAGHREATDHRQVKASGQALGEHA
jgi:hypothetical protein